MSTNERARLGPVAAVVFAVWLAANLAAGVDGIEERMTQVVQVIQRIRHVASVVIERATADGDDGDEPHACH